MPGTTDKKDFNWESGETLDDKTYDALGDVKAQGLPKIKQAVHADPELRKKSRDELIQTKQTQSYQKKTVKKDDGTIVIEETHSGLLEGLENSKAKRLIDTGKKIKGVDRFGNKKDES